MKKLTVTRKEMMKVATEKGVLGQEAKIWEKENVTHGRIIWVRKGKQILIMR